MLRAAKPVILSESSNCSERLCADTRTITEIFELLPVDRRLAP